MTEGRVHPKHFNIKDLWVFVLLQTVFLCGMLVFLVYEHGQNVQTLKATKQAAAYNCNTSNVLKFITTQGYIQVHNDFKNGDYARLIKQGVLTQAEVNVARGDLKIYQSALRLLNENKACIELTR